MEDRFKLDYCYTCGDITVLAYKGTEGSLNKETKILKYGTRNISVIGENLIFQSYLL